MNTELKIESDLVSNTIDEQREQLGLQLHEILKECMGQVDLLTELIRLFKKNMLEFIGNVRVNIENEDVEKIGFASHKIKSSLRMMNIDSLLQIAIQIETVCKGDKDLKYINFLYNQFVDEYPAIEAALDTELSKL
ncbi:MAG: Hpt domain-containing protein [Allomuricauda sp.]|nr:MAG: Hpt domain-containing protein [Allomuricauda sp.]